ncbi:MAG: hypothetical protein GEU79_01520 [Acidimicrobiia bacterium]|nr:hypothetical protein [Acidimicrobiia bacterium]
MNLAHLPLRIATGAFILHSGIEKKDAVGEHAERLHGMASNAIPPLTGIEPDNFAKLLSSAEIGLGAALLAPFLPSRLVGLGLTGFAAGLMTLYLNTPGMREPDSIRPTPDGKGLAKDVWLLGAGLTLLFSGSGRD